MSEQDKPCDQLSLLEGVVIDDNLRRLVLAKVENGQIDAIADVSPEDWKKGKWVSVMLHQPDLNSSPRAIAVQVLEFMEFSKVKD